MEPVWNKKKTKKRLTMGGGIGRHSKRLKIDNGRQTGWANLPEDILLEIFSRLKADCLFKTAYSVCRSWRSVSRLNVFYKGKSLVFFVFKNVRIHQHRHFIVLLKKILDELEVQQKCQTITLLYFPGRLHLSDGDLLYIAQRLPNVNCLYMPYTTKKITTQGFSNVVQIWKDIRELRIGPLQSLDYIHVIKEAARSCSFLKLLGTADPKPNNMKHTLVLDELTSSSISTHLSCKVQNLHLKYCLLYSSGLRNIMNKCTSLKVILVVECEHAMENNKYLHSSKRWHYSIDRVHTTHWRLLYRGRRVSDSTQSILNCLWPNQNVDIAEM